MVWNEIHISTYDVSRHIMMGPPRADGEFTLLRFRGNGNVLMSV